MTNRYENIRKALAMGPTPGPWEVVNETDVFTQLGARNAAGVEAAANDGWHIADCDMGPSFTEEGQVDIPYVEKRANAAFITACDPDTIRALLDERDALKAENERLREDAERLDWLAGDALMISGRGEHGTWETPALLVDSTREACTPRDFRAAIDRARGKGGKENSND